MELDFFTGYHGAGKSYTANKIADEFEAGIADTGPIIREEFGNSGISDFGVWNKYMEEKLGEDYSNIIVMNGIKRIVEISNPKQLFVVGNRDINGIQYIRQHMEDKDGSRILLFEKPFHVMKAGYESRTGKRLTDEEFSAILQDDEDRGLVGIKEHCKKNPDTCDIIKSDFHDFESISLAISALRRNRRNNAKINISNH